MPIIDSELRLRESEDMTQNSTAGGRIVSTLKAGGTLIGADITPAERLAGVIRHYKLHMAADDPENSVYKSPLLYLRKPLSGQIVSSIIKSTHTNTWASDSAGRKYGTALLSTQLTAGGQTIEAIGAGSSYGHFADGDKIVLTSRRSAGSGDTADTGLHEVLTIDQAPSWNGNTVTLHVSTPIQNSYPLSRVQDGVTHYTAVCAAAEYADAVAAYTPGTKTSAAGTYNTGASVIVSALNALTQDMTFTFTSATNFNVTSNRAGVTLSGGSRSAPYSNSYIQIPTAFWTGTWATGDSLVLSLTPAALPFQTVIDVPAGTPQENLSYLEIWTEGYSASV